MPSKKPTPVKPAPPTREPVTRGLPLDYDLSGIPDTAILAEAIRRGYRPLTKPVPPQAKKGTK